jgi:quinol-cytochrome oxidoreductase complex cytochrome b subunit
VLRERARAELQRPVAGQAARVPYALGLAALLLLAATMLVGMPLALQYDASEFPGALASGLTGSLRGVHAWLASLLVALALVHLARAGLTRAYAGERRRTWLLGLANLAALLAMFWLGVALRGDQQGFEAWRHGAEVLGLVGARPSGATPLNLLFWLHVLAFPALLVAAVAFHVRRVRRLDLAPLRPPAPVVPFAVHARAGARVAAMLTVIGLALAVLAPPALGPAPLENIEAARAPWPFAWLVPLQDTMGTWGIPLGLALLFGGLAALPALDARSPAAARAVLVALLAAVVVLGALALLGPAAVRIVG